MKTRTLYKHIRNIDVAFSPSIITTIDSDLHMIGFWYNISTGIPKLIDQDKIVIKKEDINNWKQSNEY